MSLDNELRDVLTAQAERREGPAPGPRGPAGRRSDRGAVAGGWSLASSGLAILLCVAVGVGLGPRGGTRSDGGPRRVARPARVTEVPWCVPDPSGGQLIEGEGAPIRTPVRRVPRRAPLAPLRHHRAHQRRQRHRAAGRRRSAHTAGNRRWERSMSHDGRSPRGWGDQLRRAITGGLRGARRPPGRDDGGRMVWGSGPPRRDRRPRSCLREPSDGRPACSTCGCTTPATASGPGRRRARPLGPRHRHVCDGRRVRGADRRGHVTAPGYGAILPVASVEGRVDDTGRFVPQREVPIGRGRWSPGPLPRRRSAAGGGRGAQCRPDHRRWSLDLPRDLGSRATAGAAAEVDLIWESPTSVLAVERPSNRVTVYRCDVRSGSCEHVDRPGQPALGNNARAGG